MSKRKLPIAVPALRLCTQPDNSMPIDAIEQLTCDLVRINSVNAFYEDGPGEAPLARFIENFFRQFSIAPTRQLVVPATDKIEARENLIVRVPGRRSDLCLLLEAHMDTVSVADMLNAPFEPRVENGKIFGRGSVDTKAGLAAMMMAIIDLQRQSNQPPCDVLFAAVVDEEYSFLGVQKLLETYRASGAIVAEPTELKIVIASKGVLRWRIASFGKSAHSAKAHLGVNAIVKMSELVQRVESYHRRLALRSHPLLGCATGNIGIIQGGVQVNLVPSECTIEIDRRLLPNESADDVLAAYQQLIDDVCRSDPSARFAMQPPYLVDPAMQTDDDSAIVRAAKKTAEEVGLDTRLSGVPFGSDASKIARKGIPSIIFGPGSIDQAHTIDEFVPIDEIHKAFEFYRGAIRNFE